VFLVSRLVWLAENPLSVGYFEESYRWVAAHEIFSSPAWPFLEYQADHYQGGSLVMIVLVAASFALFGESVLALKLPAVAISVGVLVMIYALGRRFFDRATAILASVAFILAPPLVAAMGLIVIGSHTESVFLSLVQLFVCLSILEARWRRDGAWAALGAISGIGLWFCGAGLLLYRRLPRPREATAAAAGALVGLVPWVIYNLWYDFAGFGRILEVFGYGKPIDPWLPEGPLAKVATLARELPEAAIEPYFRMLQPPLDDVLKLAFVVPFLALLAAAFTRVLRAAWGTWLRRSSQEAREERSDTRPLAVLLAYQAVFLAVFAFSQFALDPLRRPIGYRLLVPPLILAILPVASATVRAVHAGSVARSLAAVGCVSFLLASGAATLAVVALHPPDSQFVSPDRGYAVMGLLLHRKYEADLARAFALAASIPNPVSRAKVWVGIGWGMEYRFEKDGTLEEFRAQVLQTPDEARGRTLIGSHYFARVNIQELSGLAKLPGPLGESSRRRLDRLLSLKILLQEMLVEERARYLAAQPRAVAP
jgi:Dolichyl-phosphate-mannose-protein mannosyltransferase